MAIEIMCEACGAHFRAPNRHRGKTATCNGCGGGLLIEGKQVAEYDVFVSYSEHDRQIAETVATAIEAASLRCWMAPRDVQPGADWGASIIEALSNSRTMVLVFSGHANASKQVLREVERAVSKGVTIIPLRIDDAPLSQNMEYFISSNHWLDALSGPLESYLERLVRTITAITAEDDVLVVAADATEAATIIEQAPAVPAPIPNDPPASQPAAVMASDDSVQVHPIGSNPIAGGSNLESFVGTFKSDQLMMEVKGDSDRRVAGVITLGDKQFPTVGIVEDGQLKGSFESEGSRFEFTARVERGIMTLETAGTRYVMQRLVNPLDRRETTAPPNPLAATN